MLAPILLTPPASLPVSLQEAKAHLRVDFDDDDVFIGALIDAATEHLDGWTGILGRCLVEQEWRQDYSRFQPSLRLPLTPITAIVSVTFYDGSNVRETLSSDRYRLLSDGRGPYVVPSSDEPWPASFARPDAVAVTFRVGYGDEAAVPAPIKAAILLIVGHLYANREAVLVGTSAATLPLAVEALLAPFRRTCI